MKHQRPLPAANSALPRRVPVRTRGLRIGLMGGSFDPAHAGHLHCARMAIKHLRLHKVWWLVSPQNPLKPKSSPLAARLASAKAIARDPRILVTDFEQAFGLRFTHQTLAFLTGRAMGAQFFWIMGADSMAQFHQWRRWRRIAALAPLIIAPRPGAGARQQSAKAFAILKARRYAAGDLDRKQPPAWTLLSGPINPLSSTDLRLQGFGLSASQLKDAP